MKNKHLLITEFMTTPWAIQRERITAFAHVLAKWEENTNGAYEAKARTPNTVVQSGSIAVLPLYGSIFQRSNMMTDYCGGTSTMQFSQMLSDAMNDPGVSQILIDIDSPGGSVYGVKELYDQISSAAQVKPIVAIANSLAASAAYWLGCAANEFYVTPGGEVGSIGVWQAHEDMSQALETEGVKITLISAGKYKTEGNPYGPLDEDSTDFLQSRVDDYYSMFVSAVAQGRSVPEDDVLNGMGQGRVLGATDALAQKMVDGVATFDEVISLMQSRMTKSAVKNSRAENERLRLSLLA